ncbi:hypothetical protein FKM82_028296 [Ascaphus truei]
MTAGVEVSVKTVQIPDTGDSVVRPPSPCTRLCPAPHSPTVPVLTPHIYI